MKRIIFSIFAFILSLAFCLSLFAETLKELYDQGARLYAQGDYPKAIEVLEKVIKLDPNFAPAYNSLGLAYRDANTGPSELIWYFKAAVDIDSNFAEAYDNLGKAYYGVGKFDKAEEYCKKALSINPYLGSAEFSLGWIYLLGKPQPSEAIHYFKKVLEKKEIPYAYLGLGIAYFMNNENAMVLEVITALRGMNEDKLAEQLETMVREHFYLPNEGGGPLVEIRPPSERPRMTLPTPAAEGTIRINEDARKKQDVSGQASRIQMHGKLFSVPPEEKQDVSPDGEQQTLPKPKQKTVTSPPAPSKIYTTR